MKVTITNYELDTFIKTLSHPESFRNNVAIKISDDLDWALRVNIKALNARFEILNDARQELGQEFINTGKAENNQVKEEYLDEYNRRLFRLMMQKNELDFMPIKRDDYKGLPLSTPERDFLIIMVDEETDKKESEV